MLYFFTLVVVYRRESELKLLLNPDVEGQGGAGEAERTSTRGGIATSPYDFSSSARIVPGTQRGAGVIERGGRRDGEDGGAVAQQTPPSLSPSISSGRVVRSHITTAVFFFFCFY